MSGSSHMVYRIFSRSSSSYTLSQEHSTRFQTLVIKMHALSTSRCSLSRGISSCDLYSVVGLRSAAWKRFKCVDKQPWISSVTGYHLLHRTCVSTLCFLTALHALFSTKTALVGNVSIHFTYSK